MSQTKFCFVHKHKEIIITIKPFNYKMSGNQFPCVRLMGWAEKRIHASCWNEWNLKYFIEFSIPRISRLTSTFPFPAPSEVAIFTWNMRTVLNRMKNKFSDFIFLSYGDFLPKMYQNLTNSEYKNSHISKTKNRTNRKTDFLFVSAHSAFIM